MAAADGRPAPLPGRHRPRHGRQLPRLRGHRRRRQPEHRLRPARGRRLPLPHRADRGTDRLSALHATEDPCEQAQLVDGDGHGRSGLGGARRDQAGHRRLPRRLRPLRGGTGGGDRADPAVPRGVRRDDAVVAGGPAGRGPGRHQPDQDQCDQRLLRLAGVDELLHPRDPALPRPHGLRPGQPGLRADPDGGRHVQLPQRHPGLLLQLRHRLGGHRRHRHRGQQVPAETVPARTGVPPGHALRGQPGRRHRVHRGLRALHRHVLPRLRRHRPALLPRRRGRDRGRPHPGHGHRHPGPVLPAPERRRHPGAAAGRRGQPERGHVRLPRLPADLRAPGPGRLPGPRRRGLLAVPEHGQGGRPRAPGRSARPGLPLLVLAFTPVRAYAGVLAYARTHAVGVRPSRRPAAAPRSGTVRPR